MKCWKYLLIAATLVTWLATEVLTYISSYSEWPLAFITLGCAFALLIVCLSAILRRKWRELAICSIPLVVIFLPAFGVTAPSDWLQVVGFRISSSPLQSYLAECRLYRFVDEDGTEQQIGQCHTIPQIFNARLTVIYDTAGQLMLPVERRTSPWQSAVAWHLSAGMFIARNDSGRSHIFGPFYSVYVPLDREDGNDGR